MKKEKAARKNTISKPKRKDSRNKGACGERELAKHLSELGYAARRGQQFSGSPDSPDVVCPALADFHIECKRTEAGSKALYDWLAQATRDSGVKTPIVIHRQNGQPWVAVLRVEDLLARILFTGSM